jgi:hypothetical protein
VPRKGGVSLGEAGGAPRFALAAGIGNETAPRTEGRRHLVSYVPLRSGWFPATRPSNPQMKGRKAMNCIARNRGYSKKGNLSFRDLNASIAKWRART